MPTSLDDYVKRLDEKIAELEREEELERKAEEEAKKVNNEGNVNINVNNINNTSNVENLPPAIDKVIIPEATQVEEKTPDQIEKELNTIFNSNENPSNNYYASENTTQVQEINTLPPTEIGSTVRIENDTNVNDSTNNYTEQNQTQPVNIDVDSVVENNKPTDENFFDDFFGSEDE
jgi:hypothetical protein